MAWFGEAQHAANPPPYLTLWRIPIQYIWTHAESRSHGHHVMMTHVFVPYTEYTHKYNHAGIKTWGKWLQKQHICNPAGMASHRTMASGPFVNQNILHWSHWALNLTHAKTSYINACWFLPHKIMVIRCHMTPAVNQMPHQMPHRMSHRMSHRMPHSTSGTRWRVCAQLTVF